MCSVLLWFLFLPINVVTIDRVVDEGVGLEDFEDSEDFVEQGKQPFDHDYETLLLHCI